MEPTLVQEIKRAQVLDEELVAQLEAVQRGESSDFEVRDGGFLYFQGQLCVPALEDLRDRILREAHRSPFSVHPGSNKMYQDLRPFFWWPCMKRDVSEFVTRCLACQQVKAEHQVPSGLLQPI